jgi:putative transposase
MRVVRPDGGGRSRGRRPGGVVGYTAEAYESACVKLGVSQSMGRVGSALHNAAAEAFDSTVKVEYVHDSDFHTRAEARLKIA